MMAAGRTPPECPWRFVLDIPTYILLTGAGGGDGEPHAGAEAAAPLFGTSPDPLRHQLFGGGHGWHCVGGYRGEVRRRSVLLNINILYSEVEFWTEMKTILT